jgi:hypothetical protein
MFLDEPTSGLDPAAEFRLMESFQHLAVTGCTILCTTHVLGNVFLFDRLAVMCGGHLVFFGEPASALEYFGVERLTLLCLSDRQASDWPAHREGPSPPATAQPLAQRQSVAQLCPVLLLRQWAIFRARLMPSGAVQSVMDTSLFWQKKISGSIRVDFPSAFSNLNRDRSLKNGQVYVNARPASWGLGALAAWTACAYWVAWLALRGKERG